MPALKNLPAVGVGLAAWLVAGALARPVTIAVSIAKQPWEMEMETSEVVVTVAFAVALSMAVGGLFAMLLSSLATPQVRILLAVPPLAAFAAIVTMADPPFEAADMMPVGPVATLLALMVAETAGAVVAIAVLIRALVRLAYPSPVQTRLSTVAGCLAAVPAVPVLWFGTGLAEVLLTRSFASSQETWIGQDIDAGSVEFAGPVTPDLIGAGALFAAGAAYALLLSRRLPAAVPLVVGFLFLAAPVASVVTALHTTFTSSYPDPISVRSALMLAAQVPGNGGALLLASPLIVLPLLRRSAVGLRLSVEPEVPATASA